MRSVRCCRNAPPNRAPGEIRAAFFIPTRPPFLNAKEGLVRGLMPDQRDLFVFEPALLGGNLSPELDKGERGVVAVAVVDDFGQLLLRGSAGSAKKEGGGTLKEHRVEAGDCCAHCASGWYDQCELPLDFGARALELAQLGSELAQLRAHRVRLRRTAAIVAGERGGGERYRTHSKMVVLTSHETFIPMPPQTIVWFGRAG